MAARLRSLIPRAQAPFLDQLNSRSLGSKSADSHGIDLNFTPKQLNTLRSIAQHWQPEDAWCDGQASKLTQQDALAAYLVTLQNRCLPEPIQTLVNLTEYRNHTAVDPRQATSQRQPASGRNCVYISTTDLSSARDLASISRAIRRTMAMARSRDITRETYIILNGTRQNKIVHQLRGRLNVSPGSPAAWVDSQSFLSLGQGVLAQLGQPHCTQLYNEVSGEQMFSISPAMPVHGTWTRNKLKGHVVVSLRVPGEINDRMVDIMADDMRSQDEILHAPAIRYPLPPQATHYSCFPEPTPCCLLLYRYTLREPALACRVNDTRLSLLLSIYTRTRIAARIAVSNPASQIRFSAEFPFTRKAHFTPPFTPPPSHFHPSRIALFPLRCPVFSYLSAATDNAASNKKANIFENIS
ncbi:hypothetical protein GGX14DRAFT_651935 [Mycena pura]|uniref:Uncharacterized protein n=1 Tax=Mycena pura TaxID=153505 RepID=A0AAD6V884_9AGAR|nr:hypothetical protein GGX14DRAFT_651935 [Mycena pura]